jgi:uncharacterized protein (DUF488 family)
MNCPVVYSIGHSNQDQAAFVELILGAGFEVVVDIRSQPYSRYAPQFNLPTLERAVTAAGVRFEYAGRELGGRPAGREFYDESGHVDYGRVAESAFFQEGLDSLVTHAQDRRVAVMCSEEDPEFCHRRLLIGRVLQDRGIEMVHVRADGRWETDATFGRKPQLTLFAGETDGAWKSIRSVLQDDRQPISLAH